MSIHNKLILSLVNENLTLDDISPKTGFSGIYTLDINRPYLTDHIFLLYKFVATKESKKTIEKLNNFTNLYNRRIISINNTLYHLYTFTVNIPIKRIKDNGHMLLGKDEKTQICKFWNLIDKDINEYLFGYHVIGTYFKDTIIPEEDFYPKDVLIYDEKGERFILNPSP